LSAWLLCASGTATAQSENSTDQGAKITDLEIDLMRKDLRDQKKQVVAANLSLTGDEAAKFWPTYDAYTQQTIKINDRRYALFKEYAANYNTMTDTQASSYIRRWNEVDGAFTNLRLEWIPKFEQVLGPKKTAAFFQIDRRCGLMIELQLSSKLPLVQP
ncbi:MAG TPA: hypothetical protein VH477_01710, partial [Bryobacteraceae bacterium]